MPIRFSLDPDVEAEAPTIDVKQTRYDARAEVPLSGFFNQLRLRGGYAEYRHNEIEDTGEIARPPHLGRRRQGRDRPGRARRLGRHQRGAIFQRKVEIDGEEKFCRSRQHQTGLFTMQGLVRASCGSRAASASSSASWTRMRMPTLGRPR